MRSRKKIILSALRTLGSATVGRRQKKMLYAASFLLWMSGALWLFERYVSDNALPLPLWMKIHGAAAMLFLMVFGALLIHHVPVGWRHKRQRPSGIPLLLICTVLVITGWALYYLGDESIREWTSAAHSILGLLFPFVLGLHLWFAKKHKVHSDPKSDPG